VLFSDAEPVLPVPCVPCVAVQLHLSPLLCIVIQS
jgi:hypothetical protein